MKTVLTGGTPPIEIAFGIGSENFVSTRWWWMDAQELAMKNVHSGISSAEAKIYHYIGKLTGHRSEKFM